MPRTVDAVERRTRVAAAARAVIARDGPDAASVRRVAAEAGSSTTVVTHYFADKEALFAAAVEDAYRAVAARMAAHLDGPGGLTTLRAVLLEALPLDAERAAEARVWMAFWSMAASRSTLREVQSAGYAAWRELVARLLADAVERGEVAAEPGTGDVGEQLMCLVDGLLMQATLEPDRLPAACQVQLLDGALARLAPSRDPRG
jgi:AcrR family transcriptional regulator